MSCSSPFVSIPCPRARCVSISTRSSVSGLHLVVSLDHVRVRWRWGSFLTARTSSSRSCDVPLRLRLRRLVLRTSWLAALSAILPAAVAVGAPLMADMVVRHAITALASVHWPILVVISFGVAGDDIPGM
jgi:hypothetical protein